jgi:putative PIN family toxin of toxin-antitoxin system
LIRAVVDTNITVSGFLFGGIPLKVIHAAISGEFVWVTSPALMQETQRVLRSDKFEVTAEEIQKLTGPLWEAAEIIQPVHALEVIKRNPADNRVLECAVEGLCSLIVTGDRRDLLSLGHYRNIEIIKARELLGRLG